MSFMMALGTVAFKEILSLRVNPREVLSATKANALLPTYDFPNFNSETAEVNAMTLPWNDWYAIHLFP